MGVTLIIGGSSMEGGWRRGVQGRLEDVLAASSGIPKVPKYCRFFLMALALRVNRVCPSDSLEKMPLKRAADRRMLECCFTLGMRD